MEKTFEEKIQEAHEIIESGDKFTFLYMSEFGFPNCFCTREVQAKIEPYAQYRFSIQFKFKRKGDRKYRTLRILPYSNLYIFKGDTNIDVDVTNTVTDSPFCRVVSYGKSFDYSKFDRIIEASGLTPIFEYKGKD